MKGDTVLDYVELELTPPGTRYDLFVSADNVTEKLASGFLKPFLTHLRAAEEQVARGCNPVRLQHPYPGNRGRRSWFTKGTLERFVRFVSTPEVLERVKSVEDELAQLEQVRDIQASSLRQVENLFVGADSAASKADACVYSDGLDANGSSKLARKYRDDVAEDGAEASKIKLLRAMDLRLHVLKREQIAAFGRAAAAGFSSRNMADLIAFSDHFGAEHFRTACMNFLAVLKRRHTQHTPDPVPNGHAVTARDEGTLQYLQADAQDAERRQYQGDAKLSTLNSRGSGGTEVRKRWGPLENIRTNLYANQHETDSNSSNGTSNGVLSISGSPEAQSSLKETPNADIEQEMRGRDGINAAVVPEASLNLAQGKNALKVALTGHNNPILRRSLEANVDSNGGVSERSGHNNPILRRSVEANVDSNGGVSERSSLPLRKASIESSLPTHRDFSVQEPLSENGMAAGKLRAGDGSESPKVGEDVVGSEASSTPVVAPERRLSVQDAISLFENKQRRDSTDSSGKHRPTKLECSRAVSEGGAGICLSSGNSVLKRRDSGKGLEACLASMEYQLSSSKPEATGFCPAQATEGVSTGSAAPLKSTNISQQQDGLSVAQPLSESSIDIQLSVPNASARVEAGTRKNSTDTQVNAASEGAKDALTGDWMKQFKLQLEKSLSKESSLRRDSPAEAVIQRNNPGPIFPKIVINPLTCSQGNSHSMRPFIPPPPLPGSRSKEAVDRDDICAERRQALPRQDASGSRTLPLPTCEVNAEQNNLHLKNLAALDIKKEGENSSDVAKLLAVPDSATEYCRRRESRGSSLSDPLNHEDLQPLAPLADHQQTTEGDKDPGGLKGRFYEQYRKLRDAKLLDDQDTKRAEREAKLKEMEETLTRRKAEMDERSARLSNAGANQTRATKFEALKADLQTPKKEQTITSSASSPLVPYVSKDGASTSKPQSVPKKAMAVPPQKGATPPRLSSSSRSTPSVSPKLAPRSTTAAGNFRKSVGSYTTDNPLARSVPCFANLRKENTKPLPGRPSGSARVYPKKGMPGRMSGGNEVAPLEANANVPVRSRNGQTKEDPKGRSALMRKSCATVADFKTLSLSSDDGVLAPLKGQREMKPETAANNRLRRSAVSPFQEAKPFLRKGCGIGPGTGPGLVKQKAPLAAADAEKSPDEETEVDAAKSHDEETEADAAKSPDEETETPHVPEPNNSEQACQLQDGVLHESTSEEFYEMENMDLDDDAPASFASIDSSEVQVIDDHKGTTMRDSSEEATMDSFAAVDTPTEEPLPDTERACHTISFPIDMKTHDRYAMDMEFSTQNDTESLLDPDTVSLKEGGSDVVSLHEEQTMESSASHTDEVSTSLCTSSLPREHGMMPVCAPAPASPLTSHVAQYDHSSPSWASSAAKLDSPLGSPASWNSSQLQYADVSQFNKKWVACQKPTIATQPCKEPVRGFKRLLKFGRKSRASELAVSDCISASTTSEGDDESEDHGRFADEVSSSRGRLQERRYNDVPVDHWKPEEGSALNLRSSIPTPPADFRLCDDHLSGGGTLLKAPRSFFSLTSFRSKGSEMKSR